MWEKRILWEDRRGGRILRKEDTVCCATITIFRLVRQLCKKQQKMTFKQKFATIVLDKRRWRRSDEVYKDFF